LWQLSSFAIYNCLLIKNSSSALPRLLFSTSCHVVDRALLSTANMVPVPFACVSIS